MPMRSLENNDAEEFSDLICPECGRKSIREYEPLAEEYNSKRKRMLNAARCQNQNCSKSRLTKQEVKTQLKSSGFFGTIFTFVKRNPVTIGAVLIGCVVLFFGIQFLLGGGTTVTVDGSITTQKGQPVEEATVYFNDKEITTDSNGKYSVSLSPGNYTYYVKPPMPSTYGFSQPTNVTVTQDGEIQLQENVSQINIPKANSLETSLKNISKYTTTQRVSDKKLSVSFDNPRNIGINTKPYILFDGTGSNQGKLTVQTGNTITRDIQAETLVGQELQVFAPQSKTPITHTFEDTRLDYTVDNPTTVSEPTLILNGTQRKLSDTFTGSGSKTISIDSTEKTTLNATVIGQGAVETKEKSGTYTDTNPTISLSEKATVEVTVDSETETSQQSIQKTVQESSTFEITGEDSAENVELSFSESESGDQYTQTIESNGKEGTQTTQKKLFTAEKTGMYKISFEENIQQNTDLVSSGYRVGEDGDKQTVSKDQIEISVEKGTSVYIWITANHESTTKENTGQNKFSGDGSEIVEVVDYSVSSTNINSGDTITVTAELENTGDRRGASRTVLWKNGNQVLQQTVYVDAGKSKQVELASVSFQETGSVGVNGLDPTIIQVNTEGDSGKGQLTATATKTNTNETGTVNVSLSNGQSCTVSLDGGSCSFGSLQPQEYQINMNGDLSQTPYTITYTQTAKPKDVTVDIDDDGTPEISQSQLQNKTATKELPEGDHTIDITTLNNVPLNYQISWGQTTGSIKGFVAKKDGEKILEKENLKGSQRIQIEQLESKNHQFSFNSDSGKYKVIFEWVEYSQPSDVSIKLDGKEICKKAYSNSHICKLPESALEGGSHTLKTSSELDARFTYRKSSIPSQVTAKINGETHTFEKINARTIYENGTWKTSVDIDGLQSGSNTLSATAEGGKATVNARYNAPNTGAKNPQVIITTADNKRKVIKVPDSAMQNDNIFTTTYRKELDNSLFAAGKNTVKIQTDNPISVKTTIKFSSTANQSHEFNRED